MTTHQPLLPVDLLVEELRLAAMSLFTALRGFELHGLSEFAEQIAPLLDGVRMVIGGSDPNEATVLAEPVDENNILADLARIPSGSEMTR